MISIKKTLQVLAVFIGSLFISNSIQAQDAYHNWLVNYLKTTFNLTANSVFAISNNENTTINLAGNYGGTSTIVNVTGTNFTKAYKRVVTQGANPWDAGHTYRNQVAVEANDQCLIVVWLKNNGNPTKVSLFSENSTTYAKEVSTELTITSSWQLFLLPFQSSKAYAKDALSTGLHLAGSTHTVEIGGMALMNYKKSITGNQLPTQLNLPLYAGADPNAPWRAQAEDDIIKNRKTNLKLTIKTPTQQSGYSVNVEMLQHEYKFGTALPSNLINQNASGGIFEQKLFNLDGKGHGFNELVFENDLKWPGWEQSWFSPQSEIIDDIKLLNAKNITVRGHNLVWPAWQYSPSDINSSKSPDYIIDRMNNHIKAMLAPNKIGDLCNDWDVINEITTNEEYANHFKGKPGYVTGREFYPELFKLAKKLAPNAKLYINDYIAIEQADNANNGINKWQGLIDEIIKAGGPVEAIGLQGHFSAAPTGIPRAKEVLDQFYAKYKLPMKITEYDISGLVAPDVQARYMNDMLTLCFAHPSMEGFIMWGFWDGNHWLNNAPIYTKDWVLKPSGQAFIDLVFKKWWTNETKSMASNSPTSIPIFKGKHKITITTPSGSKVVKEFDSAKETEITVDLTSTPTIELDKDAINIGPNPAKNFINLTINTTLANDYSYNVINTTGMILSQGKIPANSNFIEISTTNLAQGLYSVNILNNEGRLVKGQKVMVAH
jgi:endo-1,4-beta-xylanase